MSSALYGVSKAERIRSHAVSTLSAGETTTVDAPSAVCASLARR